jgi:uncharacterized membrane protein YraQ (UPF0718 family)
MSGTTLSQSLISYPWITDFTVIFLSLFIQGIPFLLFGAFMGVFASQYLPLTEIFKKFPRNPILSSLCGIAAAPLLPSCECIAAPMIRRLIQSGLPPAAAISYLFAAPVLNPICLISTFTAFFASSPILVTGWRIFGSSLIALVLGILFSKINSSSLWKSDLIFSSNPREPKTQKVEFKIFIKSFLNDFWNVATFYLIGCLLAAWFQTYPFSLRFAAHSSQGVFGNITLMLVAFLASICSSADAFVANSFSQFSFSSKLAFLWIGPILNLKLLLIYQSLFKSKIGFYLLLIIPSLVFLMSWIILILMNR